MTRPARRVLFVCTLSLNALHAQQPEWPPSALYGRVLSVLHEGVPAAEVRVTNARGEEVARTVADGSGNYQVMRLPAGPLEVHARADGKVSATMPVPAEGFVRAATFVLEDGAALTGVLRWPDGTLVADADVSFRLFDERYGRVTWWAECTADARGAWSLSDAPLRTLTSSVFAPGYDVVCRDIGRDREDGVEVVVPKSAATLRPVELRGLPGGTRARVFSLVTRGDHISRELWLPRRAREATVDASGVARLWSLPFAHEVRVEVTGFTSMPVLARCDAGDVAGLLFEMKPLPAEVVDGSTIVRGRLVDELGAPLRAFAVVAAYRDERIGPVLTAEDGAFELRVPTYEGVIVRLGLLPGARYVANPKARLGVGGISWLAVNADASKVVRLDAARAGRLRGVLRGRDGRPWMAANVELVVHAPSGVKSAVATATDSGGRIDVAGLPPGTYTLSASDVSGLTGTVDVRVRAGGEVEPGELAFQPGGEVTGVVRSVDGSPVPSIALSISGDRRRLRNATWPGRAQAVRSDRDGRFRVPYVPAGTWVFIASEAIGAAGVGNPVILDVEDGRSVAIELTVGK